MLLAAAAGTGARATDLGIARDTAANVEAALDRAVAEGADILITTGEPCRPGRAAARWRGAGQLLPVGLPPVGQGGKAGGSAAGLARSSRGAVRRRLLAPPPCWPGCRVLSPPRYTLPHPCSHTRSQRPPTAHPTSHARRCVHGRQGLHQAAAGAQGHRPLWQGGVWVGWGGWGGCGLGAGRGAGGGVRCVARVGSSWQGGAGGGRGGDAVLVCWSVDAAQPPRLPCLRLPPSCLPGLPPPACLLRHSPAPALRCLPACLPDRRSR